MDLKKLDQTLNLKTSDDLPLNEVIQAFLLAKKASGVSKATIKTYGVELRRFFAFCEDNFVLTVMSLTPFILRMYLIHLAETGRNPGGVHIGYRTVKTLLFWYEDEIEPDGWKNPIRKVKAPKWPDVVIPPVDLEVVECLYSVCSGDSFTDKRDRALILFLLDTGLRAFEVCGALVEDLNLLTGELLIRKGKGGKSRVVCLGKRTRKEVRNYLRTRHDNSPQIWVSESGEALSYEALNSMLRRRSKKAGVKKPGLHDFRRAFALNCLRAGMDIFTLQKLTGHSDLQVLRRYLAQNTEDLVIAHGKASPVDKGLF